MDFAFWFFYGSSKRTDFVEGLQVPDGGRHRQVVWEFILQVRDEHAELRAPVAHVVQPERHKVTNRQGEGGCATLTLTLMLSRSEIYFKKQVWHAVT